MKKKRITYGVDGMMEYQALIKMGKATLKVQFTDGSITAYGQNPAQFTTTDFIVQHAIENSSDFRRGRIKKLNTIELDEELHIERNASAATREAANTEMPEMEGKSAVKDGAKAETAETAEGAGDGEAAKAEVAADAAAEPVTEVEFSCNADAKEYLEKTFGVKSSALRTRADIVSAGETYGVKIAFTE